MTVTPSLDELASAHLGLVADIVRETVRRIPSHVDQDDLTSAGMAALVQASRSFDPERGVPFARYAATRIRGGIVDELRSIDWASRAVRRKGRAVEATRSELTATLGRTPTDAETAAELGMDPDELRHHQQDLERAKVLSLNVSPTDGDPDDLLVSEDPMPEATVLRKEQLAYLIAAIEELPERLRTVVTEFFLREQPMARIATKLGVSEPRVSQMRAEALVLLRDALNTALDPHLVQQTERRSPCVVRRRDEYFRAVAERHLLRTGQGARLEISA